MKVLNINSEQLISIGINNILEKNFKNSEVISSYDYKQILHLCKKESFDVILLDIGIACFDTQKLIKILVKHQDKAAVLIFSDVNYKPFVLKYISLGASGFLDKKSSEKELVLAIQLITSGKLYLSKEMLSSIYYDNINVNGNATPFHKLSKREMDVFKLLIKGKRVKDISEIMQIHQSTTSTLKRRIMQKFKVDNLMNLKSMAMEYGY